MGHTDSLGEEIGPAKKGVGGNGGVEASILVLNLGFHDTFMTGGEFLLAGCEPLCTDKWRRVKDLSIEIR